MKIVTRVQVLYIRLGAAAHSGWGEANARAYSVVPIAENFAYGTCTVQVPYDALPDAAVAV